MFIYFIFFCQQSREVLLLCKRPGGHRLKTSKNWVQIPGLQPVSEVTMSRYIRFLPMRTRDNGSSSVAETVCECVYVCGQQCNQRKDNTGMADVSYISDTK